jgi:hypothetical protein
MERSNEIRQSLLRIFYVKNIENRFQSIKRKKNAYKKQHVKVAKLPKTSEKRRHQIANTNEFDVPDTFYSINFFNNGYSYLFEGIWQAFQSIKDSARDIWDFMKIVKAYLMSLRGLAKGAATMKHWLKSYLRPR